ncbi:DUF2274 domain-containing protein [Burkholderia gladioli]|nr:DUF2274 domain-containing protein [Burkholderia gladioli]
MQAQTHSEQVQATTLIPQMFEVFMAGDRGFKSESARKSTQPQPR